MPDTPAPIPAPADAHNRRLAANVHPAGWVNPTPAARYNLVVIGGGTARQLWSAVTCHRFPEATCRRRTARCVRMGRGVRGSRQRRGARLCGPARTLEGDKSPARKR
ncbi:hypothetical protein LBMAG56_26060 [Verrucomicrobiota bacterium]|nr:hypothetical protein LBMAG56_26060 [Verrucomicrobiota bacterium]